jgi:hypothetical protein
MDGAEVILAIDPGPADSAFVEFDGARVRQRGILCNEELLYDVETLERFGDVRHMAIEGIACYGMPVGQETFDTCIWIGRFMQAYNGPSSLVYRKDVKLHLCNSVRAKDGNVRQAIIDRYGGKESAIGRKAKPGPLYGVSSHCWSALAVAITWTETKSS